MDMPGALDLLVSRFSVVPFDFRFGPLRAVSLRLVPRFEVKQLERIIADFSPGGLVQLIRDLERVSRNEDLLASREDLLAHAGRK